MVTRFQQKVYDLTSMIPKGKVSTYKEIANAMGTEAYRAVGSALRENPFAPKVPCHRVVASDGGLGGFKGSKKGLTVEEKKTLLRNEGIKIKNNKIVNFEEKLFCFLL